MSAPPPSEPVAAPELPHLRLSVEQLNRRCRPEELSFASTAQIAEPDDVVAQERALAALELGVRIDSWSHNVFVMGMPGSGRHAVVRTLLERAAASRPKPSDWCYVNRFDDPQRPRALRMPSGRAAQLKADVRELIDELRAAVPAALESESYRNRRAEIEREIEMRREQSLEAISREAQQSQMRLVQTPQGIVIVPVRDGGALTPEQFEQLPESERQQIRQTSEALSERLRAHMETLPEWHRELHRRLRELEREATANAVRNLMQERRAAYSDCPEALDHLVKMEADLIDNAGELFRADAHASLIYGLEKVDNRLRLERYDINVIVDGRSTAGAPVVYESNPTYQNVLGDIDSVARFGVLTTDFTMVRRGALHAANGGFLILDAQRLLAAPFAWDALKQALFERRIRIDPLARRLSLVSTRTLEPEPIPLEVRVVLIGERFLYDLLTEYDSEFSELFKIAADFDETVDRTADNLPLYARIIAGTARRERLRPIEAGAVARLVEHGSRLAGDSRKLSIHRRSLEDVLREADHFAGISGSEVVRPVDIQRALDEQVRRHGRIHALTLEAIRHESLLIDCDGEVIGQVNGLSVVQVGPQLFGRPSRITASVRIGEGEVLDIEREVKLGGAIHSKGVLILSALIGARFGARLPLSLHASLVFEQSYRLVEGDSASLAEACALLSAIARVPVRQSFGVTGSINQHGTVQVIGGVNQKIEGFFDTCQMRGLTGKQGVIIPANNAPNLMLREDVTQAVERGSFHVYSVRNIDEALMLLTGVEAGARDAQGIYPPGSLNALVEQRLREFAQARREFARKAPGPSQSSKE